MALALGWPSVAWGLAHISSRELAEWQAFYALEPFGDWRADLRSAIVASVIANANRDAKKRHKPFAFKDFMPDFTPKEPKSWKDILEVVKVANAVLGGREKKR